jgi:hypothetical protein
MNIFLHDISQRKGVVARAEAAPFSRPEVEAGTALKWMRIRIMPI